MWSIMNQSFIFLFYNMAVAQWKLKKFNKKLTINNKIVEDIAFLFDLSLVIKQFSPNETKCFYWST